MALGRSLFDELGFHFVENLLLFFTHGLSQNIGFAFRKISQFLRQQHHLFLINSNSIGFFQKRRHFGQIVFNFFFAVFSFDKLRNVLNWPRTVKGIHGNQIVKLCRFEFFEILLHTNRFVLKNSYRFALLEQFESSGVIQRKLIWI